MANIQKGKSGKQKSTRSSKVAKTSSYEFMGVPGTSSTFYIVGLGTYLDPPDSSAENRPRTVFTSILVQRTNRRSEFSP